MEDFANEYIDWLKSQLKSAQRSHGEYTEITTPFLDRHNDKIQIYITKNKNEYCLTDAGEILNDLLCSGVDLSSGKRKSLLEVTLRGFGITEKDGELITKVNVGDKNSLGLHMNNLIQAMLSVSDLFYTSKEQAFSFFFDDVKDWLDINNVRYIPNIQLIGRSSLSYKFDFAIPKSKNNPERLLRIMNTPNKSITQQILWSWTDTKINRKEESRLYVVINDQEIAANEDTVINPLNNYQTIPIVWSQKEKYTEQLAA